MCLKMNNWWHAQMQWELPCIYLACRWRAGKGKLSQASLRRSIGPEKSARAGIFNMAQLWFCFELFMWTFLGEKMGKEQLSWFNTVYSLMLSDFDTDRAAAEYRPLRWGMRAEKNVSCFQNILFIGISDTGNKFCSAALGELYQHTTQAANQPIYQPLALKAFLTPCAHQGLASKMFFWRAERGEMSRSVWLTNENQ